MYDEIGTRELRLEMAQVLDRLLANGRRAMITRHGRAVAGLVTAADLRALDTADASSREFHEMVAERRLREIQRLKEAIYQERG